MRYARRPERSGEQDSHGLSSGRNWRATGELLAPRLRELTEIHELSLPETWAARELPILRAAVAEIDGGAGRGRAGSWGKVRRG